MSHNLHDLNFKAMMAHRDFFIAACQIYLPKSLCRRIQWSSLELYKLSGEQTRAQSEMGDLTEARADVIYLFKLDDDQAGMFIVSFEHQSTPDRLMPLRCAAYNCNALLDYSKTQGVDSALPVIFNIVYYHGRKSPYPFSMDLWDLFANKQLARRYLFNPSLVDVGQLSDDDIRHHGLIAPAEYLFKRALGRGIGRTHIKSFVQLVKMNYNLGEQLPPIVVEMLKYGLELSDIDDRIFIEEVVKALPEYEGELMTTADQLRQQGAQRAAAETARQMALKMLQEGADIDFAHKVSGLSKSELRKLAKEAKTEQ